ncbi:hypothetical protein DBR42_09720, partial [Pelomonas sp. HMWF004]
MSHIMDRTAFEYLYLHANALAELGFMRATVALVAAAHAEPTPEQLAARAAFAEAVMNPDPDKFDWSVFDGMEIPSGLEEPAAELAPVVDLGPSFEEAMESLGASYDFETVPELEPYVQRLYAAGPLLEVRITAHHKVVEPPLDEAVMALDAEPAPLQGPLTPEQLLLWLQRYEAQDVAVRRVVQLARSFD